MQYIIFIHKNTDSDTNQYEYDQFIREAQESGLFRGGSEIADRSLIGTKGTADITDSIGGYMHFDTDDKQALLNLLEKHPVVQHGGCLELCEMPKESLRPLQT